MEQVQDKSISWEYNAPKVESTEERSTLAKLIGVGTLIGASFFSGSRIDAFEPPAPPAVVQNVDAQVVQKAEVQRVAPVVYTTIDAIPSVFNKDAHVYVVNDKSGSPAVSEAQLKELNARLAGSPHYLVIIDKVADYKFTTSENVHLSGKDAAYVMLGQKVFDNAQFRAVTDTRLGTPEKSASLFVLTCDPGQGNKQRDWWMSASPLLEKFGISDEHDWKDGQAYGKIAIPYFQRRDFAQGIDLTLNRLDQDLSQKISVVQSQHREQERAGNLAVTSAVSQLAEYQSRLSDLNTRFPSRSGDLFRPGDIPQLVQRVEQAKEAVKAGDFINAKAIGTAVQDTLTPRVSGLVEYVGAEQRIDSVKNEVTGLQKHEFAYTARANYNQVNTIISEAQSKWERGEASYSASIDLARKSVLDLKGALEGAVRQYSNDGETITRLISESDTLSKSDQVSGAADQLATVKAELGRAEKAWSEKDPGYPDILRSAEKDLENVAQLIHDKEAEVAASNFRWNLFYGFNMALLAGAAIAGAFRNQTVRERAQEARDGFQKLLKGMQEKQEGLEALELLKERALTNEGKPLVLAPDSVTGKLADQARKALEKLWLFQVVANEEVLTQAADKIKSGGVLSTQNYDQAIEILTSGKVEFSDKNRSKIARAFSEKRGGIAALQIPIEQVAEFKRSMKEIDKEHIKLAAVATENLEKIVAARDGIGSEMARLNQGVSTLRDASSALAELARKNGESDGLFTLPDLGSKLIPALEKHIQAVAAEEFSDPVEASEKAKFLLAVLMVVEVSVLALSKQRSGVVPSILVLESELIGSGLKTDWVQGELKGISDRADEYVNSAIQALNPKGSASLEERDFSEEFQALLSRCQKAVELNGERRSIIEKGLETTGKLIDESRDEIAARLKVEPEKVFLEEQTPVGPYAEARRAHLEIQSALSQGDLDRAAASIREAGDQLKSADACVQASLGVLEQYGGKSEELKLRKADIEKVLPKAETLLEKLETRYAPEALKFKKSDQPLPGADSTVANNIVEANEGLEVAAGALEQAETNFSQAKLLAAAGELHRADDGLIFAADRLNEIKSKDSKLTALMDHNQKLFASAEQRLAGLVETVKADSVISEDTGSILKDRAKPLVKEIRQLAKSSPVDPYAVSAHQADLDDALNAAGKAIDGDRAQFQRATESIEALQSALTKALDVSRKAEGNQVPDSKLTDQAQEQLTQFKHEVEVLSEEFKQASRADWRSFEKRADELSLEVAQAQKTIVSEEEKGKELLARVHEAGEVASSASRWSGKYGITISGNPGSSELKEAKKYLSRGEYDLASAWIERSISSAQSAISEAEEAVRHEAARIRAQQEAEERARQAEEDAAAARRASMYSSSSFGSSSSSSSSFGGFGGFGGGSSGGSSFGGFSSGSSGGTSVGGW